MASTTNAKTTPASTPSSGSTGGGNTQDTKLLSLIRANAQQIIAAINLAAAREGDGGRLGAMTVLEQLRELAS